MYAIDEVKLAICYVYVPPYAGDADRVNNPEKMDVISGIFRDVKCFIEHSRAIDYDLAIITDGNGRFNDTLKDRTWNDMARKRWSPMRRR